MTNIKLQVYTPAGKVVEEQVTSITLPTEMGQIQILTDHISHTGLLAIGILEYTNIDGQTKKLVISGGFSNFSKTDGETLMILADSVDLVDNNQKETLLKTNLEDQELVKSGTMYDPKWQLAKNRIDRLAAIESL